MLTREKPREFIGATVKPALKAEVQRIAKARGVSLSRAVEYAMEQFVKNGGK